MLLSDQQTVTVALRHVTMSYPCYDSCVRYNNQENRDYAITSVMHVWQLAIIHLKRKKFAKHSKKYEGKMVFGL